MLLEVCIDTVASAVEAEAGGAHRLEICGDLSIGGITPSEDLLKEVKTKTALPLMMMIRPRGGDFVYADQELDQMTKSIELGKKYDVQGFVFGCLTNKGDLDVSGCRKLLGHTEGYETTFHRAYDETEETAAIINSIVELGFDRLLTSGLKPSALEGATHIKKLVEQLGDKIKILPGSGVTSKNAKQIISSTGASEIHGSCKGPDGHTHRSEVAAVLANISGI